MTTSVNFRESFIHADVLCVGCYLNYTLAGIGNSLFVYSERDLKLSEVIFLGERVHSIHVNDDSILLKGGRELCLVKLVENEGDVRCRVISRIQCSDWIQDVVMVDKLIGLVTAHNVFEIWDSGRLKAIPSEEKCILYSCKIIGDSLENIIVLAGTVFGEVLIWAPYCWENLLQRLKGHNGAVFSIEVKQCEKLLSTTSDDRSLKIWSIMCQKSLDHPESWKESKIHLLHTLFGHTARVWRSLIISDYYVTVGEDSKLIVWGRDGKLIKTISLHQESGIRALHYCKATNTITTGGEDGGINKFSLNSLVSQPEPSRILTLEQNFSTRVSFTKNGVVYTINGGCVFLSSAGKEVVYKNDNFLTYCLMEVSPQGDYVFLGSIKGHLVVIDAETKVELINEHVVDGRVYSIHWLNGLLLTCGSNGRLDLWDFKNTVLKHLGVMELPSCKERWTTCGVIVNGSVIVGDRMGNVYAYKLNGRPVQSFRKIHSYLGVTDIIKDETAVFSIGRDGTIKTFTENFTHSSTYKLPIEWPWRIIKYKGDILILGFQSVSFVVWSMRNREIIASHDCGGGHRSCDYKLNKNKLTFLYVKEKKVFTVDLILDGITRIRNGFHGKEINCLRILKTRPAIMVTGSEDTTLRITRLEKSGVEDVAVMKTHVSSVRAVSACHVDSDKLFMVSVGGKGQMVVWIFDLMAEKCEEVVNHLLRKETKSWKSSVPLIDPDTRFMCVDVIKVADGFLIVSGCSDCQIRLFLYNGDLRTLCSIPYTHCILNIAILNAGQIASMGTDGRIVFWDVSDYDNVTQMNAFTLHQSGINSFHFEDMGQQNFVLATGGDDNLISVALVKISGREVSLRGVWKNSQTHSCQITGIKILKDLLLTTSIDQRITVWRWGMKEGEFNIDFLNQCLTSVPDVQGMDATWYNESSVLVTVHGKGMETMKVDVYSANRNEDSETSQHTMKESPSWRVLLAWETQPR